MLLIGCRPIVFILDKVHGMDARTAAGKLGNAIRKKRLALELSQDAFAEQCGLHRTYMGGIERGERNVSLTNIVKIARALKMSASSLFKEAGL